MPLADIGNEATARRTRKERGIYAASLDSSVGASALYSIAIAKPPVKRHKSVTIQFEHPGSPPSPLPREREHISTALEKPLNRGPFVRCQTVHPLLGERAGVRGTAMSSNRDSYSETKHALERFMGRGTDSSELAELEFNRKATGNSSRPPIQP